MRINKELMIKKIIKLNIKLNLSEGSLGLISSKLILGGLRDIGCCRSSSISSNRGSLLWEKKEVNKEKEVIAYSKSL